jgi:hypothetical protein
LRLNTNFHGNSNDPSNMSQKMVLEINQEYFLEILIKGATIYAEISDIVHLQRKKCFTTGFMS